MTDHAKIQKLEELYATIPTVNCKRLCGFGCCGPVQATKLETDRAEEKVGLVILENYKTNVHENIMSIFIFKHLSYHLPESEFMQNMKFWKARLPDFDCQFLMPVIGSCRIYKLRPLICRLWGTINVDKMRCPHGCQPTRWLKPEEAREYFRKVVKIEQA